jgi:DivIVA domain-containing protein
MIVVFLACLVGLVVVLVALASDGPPAAEESQPAAPAALTPKPRAVRIPADVMRTDFPLSWPGYDRAAVEAHLDAVAQAWGEFLALAPPEDGPRTRRLASQLRTKGRGQTVAQPVPPPPLEPCLSSALEGADPDSDAEAIRSHAALELLRRQREG